MVQASSVMQPSCEKCASQGCVSSRSEKGNGVTASGAAALWQGSTAHLPQCILADGLLSWPSTPSLAGHHSHLHVRGGVRRNVCWARGGGRQRKEVPSGDGQRQALARGLCRQRKQLLAVNTNGPAEGGRAGA